MESRGCTPECIIERFLAAHAADDEDIIGAAKTQRGDEGGDEENGENRYYPEVSMRIYHFAGSSAKSLLPPVFLTNRISERRIPLSTDLHIS